MRILILPLLMCLLLTGCEYLPAYQAPVQQGNIFSNDKVQQLQIGMSEDDVLNLLGSPVLENTFADNRFSYVYTYKSMQQPYTLKTLVLVFNNNGRLVKITSNSNGNTQHLRPTPSLHF